jgi:hypothetical protein
MKIGTWLCHNSFSFSTCQPVSTIPISDPKNKNIRAKVRPLSFTKRIGLSLTIWIYRKKNGGLQAAVSPVSLAQKT